MKSILFSICDDFRKIKNVLLEGRLSLWSAGIAIAFIALILFLWQAPWGVAGGYRNWGDWFWYLTGLIKEKPQYPWLNGISLTNLGIFIGAFVSAMSRSEFRIQPTKPIECGKAFFGGILMGCGATLAKGCNVGGFYSAIGMFSLGGYFMMFGLTLGAYLGLRYLVWEMQAFPQKQKVSTIINQNDHVGKEKNEIARILISFLLSIAVLIIFNIYSKYDHTVEGGQLFFGYLLGWILHRSRFCFVRTFRCPFMTGDSEMIKVVALSLIIYSAGSAIIKWLYIQPVTMSTYHPFWIGSLAGGFLFGIGMVIAGACASSTLWRLGEGNIKLLITLVVFSLVDSFSHYLLWKFGLSSFLGTGICIPEGFGWKYTISIFALFIMGWILLANWNERYEKLTIF